MNNRTSIKKELYDEEELMAILLDVLNVALFGQATDDKTAK